MNQLQPLIHDLAGQAVEAGRLVSISSVDLKLGTKIAFDF